MVTKRKPLTRAALIAVGIPLIFFPGLVLASLLGWDWQRGLGELRDVGYKNSEIIFPDEARVASVSDGDTIELENGQSVRLIGINAPDRGEDGFELSRDYLKDLIEGEEVKLEYDSYQEDKFGRLLAYVFEKCRTSIGCENGKRMVNFVMVKKNLAEFVVYKDRRKLKYQDLLLSGKE